MNEQESQAEHLEAFRGNFEQGIDEMLEMADFLFDRPKPLDPYSMGFDDRTIDELTDQEKLIAREVIYQKLGIASGELGETSVRSYSTEAAENSKTPGEIKVAVFITNTPDIYLQELTYHNGDQSWVIGPNQDI